MKFPHPIARLQANIAINMVNSEMAKDMMGQMEFNHRMNQYIETHSFEIIEGKEGEGMSLKAIKKAVSQN
jgi:hypothetical protein